MTNIHQLIIPAKIGPDVVSFKVPHGFTLELELHSFTAQNIAANNYHATDTALGTFTHSQSLDLTTLIHDVREFTYTDYLLPFPELPENPLLVLIGTYVPDHDSHAHGAIY